jgi:hypothetical protein
MDLYLLQDLAVNASNPSEFLSKYKEASSLGIQTLGPMMGVLHAMASDPMAKTHFSATTAKSSEAADFQALKERLLQQVPKIPHLN